MKKPIPNLNIFEIESLIFRLLNGKKINKEIAMLLLTDFKEVLNKKLK
jgi:hypothetical protein